MLPKISLFCSAINTERWPYFMESLKKNTVPYEVVFAGPKDGPALENLRHIKTGDIKPAQCAQIAALESRGELLGLTADDAIYPDGLLDEVWSLYQEYGDNCIYSVRTNEREMDCPVESFTIGDREGTPIMAPFGFYAKSLWERLGGFDNRYVSGQFENDFVMRAYYQLNVGLIAINHYCIKVNHVASSRFSHFHDMGRMVLTNSWAVGGFVAGKSQRDYAWLLDKRNDEFSGYDCSCDNFYNKSQGMKVSQWA